MPPKTTNNKATLDEFVNKQVYAQQHYADTKEGPFLFLGTDQGFVKLSKDGQEFWWSLKGIAAIRLYTEEETDGNT